MALVRRSFGPFYFFSLVWLLCVRWKMHFIELSAVRITQAYLKCFWANFWQLVTEDNVYTMRKGMEQSTKYWNDDFAHSQISKFFSSIYVRLNVCLREKITAAWTIVENLVCVSLHVFVHALLVLLFFFSFRIVLILFSQVEFWFESNIIQ